MNKKLFLPHYLKYRVKAKGLHGIHSAFVYSLYENVICPTFPYHDFGSIEQVRKEMLQSGRAIEVLDFGAGSTANKIRTVGGIIRSSSISRKTGRMLFRLANFLQPSAMIEMGTSLGISTLYLAKACPYADFTTMEGSPEKAKIAAENFKLLQAANVKVIAGDFTRTLPEVLKNTGDIDFVFFDGNHRKEATLDYFNRFLPKVRNNGVFVFDDIRWSVGMFEAWNEIIKEKRATVTIDLFNIGIVFFRSGQTKQHFVLKF